MTLNLFPRTAGELLAHLEAAGQGDNWLIDTDPADARDQCGSVRRTFRLRALDDAECAVVFEYGAGFIVVGTTDVRLSDLHRPGAVDALLDGAHCAPVEQFLHALEHLFPRNNP